jgi:hypothetical protein
VQEAICDIWPDGIVEMSLDPGGVMFLRTSPEAIKSPRRIRDARPLYEREANGGPVWREESDAEDEPPYEISRSHSYHTFFGGGCDGASESLSSSV